MPGSKLMRVRQSFLVQVPIPDIKAASFKNLSIVRQRNQ